MKSFIRIATILLAIVVGQSPMAQELKAPEDIVFLPELDTYVVSNAGDGLLRKMDSDGTTSLFGLEAKGSHGLAVQGQTLYACYRGELRCYDIVNEELKDIASPNGATFLNDVCVGPRGIIYACDFNSRKIYKMSLHGDGTFKSTRPWKTIDRIPSSLVYDESREELLVTTWAKDAEIVCIEDEYARIVERIDTGYDNIESIYLNQEGIAIISAWGPDVIFSYPNGLRGQSEELDELHITRPTGIIETDEGQLLVLSADIATSHDILKSSGANAGVEDISLTVFPNPISTSSLVSYDLEESGHVIVELYDCKGNRIETLSSGRKDSGTHQIFYERGEIASGLYFIHVQSGDMSQALAVTILD